MTGVQTCALPISGITALQLEDLEQQLLGLADGRQHAQKDDGGDRQLGNRRLPPGVGEVAKACGEQDGGGIDALIEACIGELAANEGASDFALVFSEVQSGSVQARESLSLKELCAEIDELRARISTLTNELEASRAQLDKGDALAENLQGAAVALTAECNVLNYRLAAAQTSLVESQTEAREARERLTEAEQVNDDLGRRLSESEINQTNTWKRVEMLEQSLSALQLEYDEQRSAYHRYRETQTAETTALRASVDELGSRAAAAEKSLDDMRAETQARMAELRKTERRAEQAETRLAAVEERAEKLQDELAHSVENAARVEISRKQSIAIGPA